MLVKAQIARPGFADTVRAGEKYCTHGAAWTSEAEITKGEISTDGGETWRGADLVEESAHNAWRLWEYDWQVPEKQGRATLVVRATDSNGRTQPTERDPDRRSYLVNHLLPTEVDVRWPGRFHSFLGGAVIANCADVRWSGVTPHFQLMTWLL
jgi:hypothetical protein